MKSDLAYSGDNRGDAVCEIAIRGTADLDRCIVRGRTGQSAEGRPRQAQRAGSVLGARAVIFYE